MKFQSDEEIDHFLAAFETGTIPKQEWTHKAHVAVAGAYVWTDPDGALPLLRYGILSLNRRHQTRNTIDSGYHETLTVFWVSIIRDFCKEKRSAGRLNAINEMLDRLPAGLFKEFYGFDVVKSQKARERWVAPDLQPLPGEDMN